MKFGALDTTAGPSRLLMTVDAVGGVWRYAMTLGAALQRRGIEVIFLGLGPEPKEAQHSEAEAIGQLCWLEEKLDWTAGREKEAEAVGTAIAGVARRLKPDLIQVNVPSQATRLPVDIPLVAVSHSCVPTWCMAVQGRPPAGDWSWHLPLTRRGLTAADAVLAPSRAHAEAVREIYGTSVDVNVVHNATDLPEQENAGEAMVLAAARWWDEGKNGETLDRAAEGLSWPVLMAGSCAGPQGQQFRPQHAQTLGEMDAGELALQMRRAAIFVAPSIYEPFGLAPLEAARCGASLVLADIPVFREIWDGCALFFPPRDAAALRAALHRLIEDDDLRRQIAQRARLRARDFTAERQADRMMGIYRPALSRQPQSECA